MKNILITCDSFTNGGLEQRLLEEIKYYKKHRINVFLATKDFNEAFEDNFKQIYRFDEIVFNSGETMHIPKFKKEQKKLEEFCKKNKIDYIECHPFYNPLLSIITASRLKIPIDYTLHGLTSGNFIFDSGVSAIYYLAMKYGTDQLFSVAEYLSNQYSYLSNNIVVYRNGFQGKTVASSYDSFMPKIAIASRLDLVKTQAIIEFISKVHDYAGIEQIDIYGDGDQIDNLKLFIKTKNYNKVRVLGWVNDLRRTLTKNNYLAVFGMGKVAIDSINLKIPTGIIGYKGYDGFITNDTFHYFAKYNFTSWHSTSTDEIPGIIDKIKRNPNHFLINQANLKELNEEQILEGHLNDITNIKFTEKPIVSLLDECINSFNEEVFSISILKKFDKQFDDTFDIFYNQSIKKIITINDLLYDIAQKNSENKLLKTQLSSFTDSKLWKASRKIKRLLSSSHNKKETDIEITAVLCVFNEELNIDGCLKHLEPYVDRIIIYDDGSTDSTVNIAKKHRKVIKIIKNNNKKFWNERLNREIVLKEAYKLSRNKSNSWALCIDADERFETRFLQNLKTIANEYNNKNVAISVRFRELWDSPDKYRIDGVWGEKRKSIFFQLSPKMTFNYSQEHHIAWYYEEINGQEIPVEYNLYHLKMINEEDRKKRIDLYKQLDPNNKMQPIGYDYLNDTTGIKTITIDDTNQYDQTTIPDYYN